jgi:hypothetical protein
LLDETPTAVDALVGWELRVDVKDFEDDEDEACAVVLSKLDTLVVFEVFVEALRDDVCEVDVTLDSE